MVIGSEAVHFAVDSSKGDTFGSVISEAVDLEAISPGDATCESVTLEAAAFGAAKSATRWVQAWIDASSPPSPWRQSLKHSTTGNGTQDLV